MQDLAGGHISHVQCEVGNLWRGGVVRVAERPGLRQSYPTNSPLCIAEGRAQQGHCRRLHAGLWVYAHLRI